ncbi:MAG: hypothetical protein EA405_12850 [Rhodospirillales bacterium]|nr:MAG: hypothetical protein EA405_12850 [Rhodospirillales bacterium]
MTHAEFAAKLLREAAHIFRSVGGGDPDSDAQTEEFAQIFEHAANLVEADPTGSLDTSLGQ